MYIKPFRSTEVPVVFFKDTAEARRYRHAGLPVFSRLGCQILRAANANKTGEMPAIHHKTHQLPKIEARLRRQARQAETNGPPTIVKSLGEMARHFMEFSEYPITTRPDGVVLTVPDAAVIVQNAFVEFVNNPVAGPNQ